MKHIFRVFFALALFCGLGSVAHAQGWHAGVVDPPNVCVQFACTVFDSSMTVNGAVFAIGGCSASSEVPAPPPGETGPFCVDLFNATGLDITSVSMMLTGLPAGGICDSNSVFMATTCDLTPGGPNLFTFTGDLPLGHTAVIYEYGLPASDFADATITVTTTPEPDSLLLLGTGVMMAGLYFARQRNLFAFGRK